MVGAARKHLNQRVQERKRAVVLITGGKGRPHCIRRVDADGILAWINRGLGWLKRVAKPVSAVEVPIAGDSL